MKLTLCIASFNEEENIHYPLDSCIDWVDEVVIVDGGSTDKTVEIAKSYGRKVRVFIEKNPAMFHINKQKALDRATGEWILQLDADEKVTPELAQEIKKVIKMDQKEMEEYQQNLPNKELFLKHQKLIEEQSRKSGGLSRFPSRQCSFVRAGGSPATSTPAFSAFYIPRLNYFLGKFLRYGGQYPDGSIRLIKRGKAHFPCKDIHEVMEVDGRVGWLQNDLLHYDSPTFKRYIARNNRYINLMVSEFQQQKLEKNFMNFINFLLYKPIIWFFLTTIRHKGILDGWQGIVFSFFSALRFPRAYIKYLL